MSLNYKLILAVFCWAFLAFGADAKFINHNDDEFIKIAGRVYDSRDDSFRLDCMDHSILVKFSKKNWTSSGFNLLTDDLVVITGRIDRNFFRNRELDATSIFVERLNSHFFQKNPQGLRSINYSAPQFYNSVPLYKQAAVDIQGRVIKVFGRKFKLITKKRVITVNTESMVFNPLDDVGHIKINQGDRVKVSGVVDESYLSGGELTADFVAEL